MTTKEYISKDEVKFLFKKLILKDNPEIQDYVNGWNKSLDLLIWFIEDIPTFSPEKIIEEMMTEETPYNEWDFEHQAYISGLEEALTRLRAENIS